MTYDSNLNPVLERASNEELEVLCDIIRARDTEDLTSHPDYIAHNPDHSQYNHVIANEIREFGGNTFRNMWRGGGPAYFEVLCDVADKLDAPYNRKQDVVTIETSILSTVLTKALDNMTEEERQDLFAEIGKVNLSITGPISAAAVQILLRAGGFASYKLMLIVANGLVSSVLGRGLPFVVNTALTRTLGVALGPIGWIATGLWTVISLGDPAYKITIPSVVYVAWLRQCQMATNCPKCEAMVHMGAAFCPECGTDLHGVQ